MKIILLQFFCVVIIVNVSSGLAQTSSCGDWTPYLHETCFKFVDRAGAQNKNDAEDVCGSFAEELHQEDVPKLITIKTKEKQEMVQTYLFEKRTTFDNVWLGLDMNSEGEFRWNDDDTKLLYSNWSEQNLTNHDRRCVQMESGEGAYKAGKWSRVHCEKRNGVICEKMQPWSSTVLRNRILSLSLELEKNRKDAEATINELSRELQNVKRESEHKIEKVQQESDSKIKDAKQHSEDEIKMAKEQSERNVAMAKQEADNKITTLKTQFENRMSALRNEASAQVTAVTNQVNALMQIPVPIGYIYIQLPGKLPPKTFWPQVNWKDVTTEYAGLFFRAEGGGAASFGQVQEDNTRRLLQIGAANVLGPPEPIVPENGSWSEWRYTGGTSGTPHSLRFRLTPGEIRPRNKAVKIWQRV